MMMSMGGGPATSEFGGIRIADWALALVYLALAFVVILVIVSVVRVVFQGLAVLRQSQPQDESLAVRFRARLRKKHPEGTSPDSSSALLRRASLDYFTALMSRFQQTRVGRLSARSGRQLLEFSRSISSRAAPVLESFRKKYGESIDGLSLNGQEVHAAVFNENEVRAAAGLTMALGAVAFVYAYFAKAYMPIQIVTTLFFVEFLIRLTAGLKYSPMGMLARLMTQRHPPQWVSAKPKRFAWTLGLVMSLAMMIITNSGIRGPLPLTICLICLTLMWLEAVLGLCLGCEIHRIMVRRGWATKDADFEVCAHGACTIETQQKTGQPT